MTPRVYVVACLLACIGVGASGCRPDLAEICGLSTELPDIAAGKASATRSDGDDFHVDASWKPGSGGSLTLGVLDMIIEKEENGSDTAKLVEDGAFPICVRLGERGDKTGSANYVSGGYVTNASHTGAVAILGNDDDVLRGRFEVDLANPAGDELGFTDGQFAARLR